MHNNYRILIGLIKTLLVMSATVILAGCGHAPDTKEGDDKLGTGILYGNRHAFTITAPEGWVLDNSSGVNQGLHAVFYPEGSSWKEAETVMYANGYDKQNVLDTLESFMEGDAESFRNKHPDIEIKDAGTRELPRGVASIRHFFGENYESVAYIDSEGAVIVIVMSSRTEKEFFVNYGAFLELIDSYFFLTSDVRHK